ncbi:hypothetical protein [Streptomyces benahoarensis]|uniref:Peptidoglycan-binding protein n=1 Tax=Streptomyces benahoarensis TaxID=2595054 RepID=A0A553ZS69_9ACTN|nr:hypothetical protein [Streptomyces benahoarensis]TSB32649.1 hypothetical protein FNJ62_00835 [Streptomyces benahoarensis]TSB44205.1 hypothetical protein FNZ23_00130 [Streptomyces benahoarensis]
MSSTESAPAPGRSRGRRVAVVAVALTVLAGGAAGAMALSAHGRDQQPKEAGAPSAGTIKIVRADLADSRTLPGALGFGGQRTVKGTGKGAVTKLPKTDTTVARGKPLYWVDDRPVMVFFGDTPVFRTLGTAGTSGRDVTVLAENLRALGYDTGPTPRATGPADGAEPGTELTPALLAALKRWQHDTGQQETGKLVPGQVVVLPGPYRVSGIKAQLGDPAAEEILTVTSVHKSVRVKVEAQESGPIHKGDPVTLTLPDTKTVPGKVTSVGQTVQGGADDDASGSPSDATLQVTVEPTDSAAVKNLSSASVQVTFTTEKRKQVLTVPVGSLLALREGGYALQRPGGQLVAVKTGLFSKGMVEVSGAGIKEGDRVVTTS